MRLLPVSPGNIRQLSDPAELVDSGGQRYSLAAGTNYILAHQTMSRSPAWIPRPDTFLPDRWIRGSSLHHTIHPFLSLPFGWATPLFNHFQPECDWCRFGPRMCIGRRLAWLELTAVLAVLLNRFTFGWTGPELETKSEILNFPVLPLHFTLTPRQDRPPGSDL